MQPVVSGSASHVPDPGDLDRFELFAEQLGLAAELVCDGRPARARLALVAIDNLAEVVLYRHMQFTFGASEDLGGRLAVRRFGQRERDRLRQNFDRKVTLALHKEEGLHAFAFPSPVLDEEDAVVFRIAHRYRNGLHHEDRANGALLNPLARLYLGAVGRAWCRAQPSMSVGGLSAGRLSELPTTAAVSDDGLVAFPGAAQRVVEAALADMAVDAKELAARLAYDLRRRADGADGARIELVRCGLADDAHADMLRTAELRHAHRADPQLIELQDRASAAMARLIETPEDTKEWDKLAVEYRGAEDAQRERIGHLHAAFRPELSLGTGDEMRGAAGRLEQVRDVDRLLQRYERLDSRMRLLEECWAWVDREWDRYISLEMDIARGK
jgi:hypothetical protein